MGDTSYSVNQNDKTAIPPDGVAEDVDHQSISKNVQHAATISSSHPDNVPSCDNQKKHGPSTVEMKNPSEKTLVNRGAPPPSYGSLDCGNDGNKPHTHNQRDIIHPQPIVITVQEPDTSSCNGPCLRKAVLIASVISIIVACLKIMVMNLT